MALPANHTITDLARLSGATSSAFPVIRTRSDNSDPRKALNSKRQALSSDISAVADGDAGSPDQSDHFSWSLRMVQEPPEGPEMRRRTVSPGFAGTSR